MRGLERCPKNQSASCPRGRACMFRVMNDAILRKILFCTCLLASPSRIAVCCCMSWSTPSSSTPEVQILLPDYVVTALEQGDDLAIKAVTSADVDEWILAAGGNVNTVFDATSSYGNVYRDNTLLMIAAGFGHLVFVEAL
eukprot:437704-Prymnesium_polylepis.2